MTRPDPVVTVIIPVKNGGPRLRECLTAVAAQNCDFTFDVLCVDSGSTDDSLDTIREFGTRLIEIPPHEFGHGRTRNLAIRNTSAKFVAMLTQDTVPASDRWLQELVAPMLEDERVAGVFGPHKPHPGCIPTEAYLLERHFQNFGSDTTPYAIPPGPDGWKQYEDNIALYRFFSDNNAALRRSVWERIPYRDVEFMEDQLWAQDVLEAGYVKVYAPRAAVRHSHNYSPLTLLRRTFDETRYFREYCDPPNAPGLKGWLRQAGAQTKLDIQRLREDASLSLRQKLQWVIPAVARNGAQAAGGFLGDRYEILPERTVRRISQHHSLKGDAHLSSRPAFSRALWNITARSLSERGMIETASSTVLEGGRALKDGLQTGWTWSLIRLRRRAEAALEAKSKEAGWWARAEYDLVDAKAPLTFTRRKPSRDGKLTVNWVIPVMGRGGGGHMTIFRMIQKLERRGHPQRVYILDGLRSALPRSSVRLQSLVHEWFLPIDAKVQHLDGEMEPADVVVATSWHTAYAVRASGCAPVKCYFVQDFEPSFYAAGAEARLAEDTYSFGFRGITAGTWLEHLLRERYGMQTRSFRLGVDPDEYFPELGERPARRRVFAYMRPYTARRGFELTALALRRIKERIPDVEIHIAGYELAKDALPFEFIGHGILDVPALRALFSSCELAICPSFTNYSLMPQELAACGCPVIDINVESTRDAYPPGSVVLAPPTVEGLVEAAITLLTDEDRRRAQVRAGLEYARGLSWDAAGEAVEAALVEYAGLDAQDSSIAERKRTAE